MKNETSAFGFLPRPPVMLGLFWPFHNFFKTFFVISGPNNFRFNSRLWLFAQVRDVLFSHLHVIRLRHDAATIQVFTLALVYIDGSRAVIV